MKPFAWAALGLCLCLQAAEAQDNGDPVTPPVEEPEAPIQAAQSAQSGSETLMSLDWVERFAPNGGLDAHGADLLGDSIDPHTGRLSFEQVDVSLPGNSGLVVELRRRLNASQAENNELYDWQLAVPTISTKILENEFYQGVRWGKTRCSAPLKDAIPLSYFAQDQLNSLATPVQPQDYNDGVTLDVPGRVTDTLLDKTVTAGWPTAAAKVTVSGWYLTCIANIDGQGTEGFIAVAPNGDRYRFDVIRERRRVASNDNWFIRHTPTGPLTSHATQRISYDVLGVSEVTDVNGNWVRYEYNAAGRVSRIHANDLREIQIPGTGFTIGSVIASPGTADARTWTYGGGTYWVSEYLAPSVSNGVPASTVAGYTVLNQVTLPNGRTWQYRLAGLHAKAIPGDSYLTIPGNIPVECVQLEQLVTVTHPDGVVGEFELGELRRFLPNSAVSQYGPPCPNASIGFGANTVADVMAVVKKTLTTPNSPIAVWEYDYFDAGQVTPNGQNGPNRTVIKRPDGHYQYLHYYPGGSHMRLVREEVFNQVTDTLPVQAVDYTYLIESPAGSDFVNGNGFDVTNPVRLELSTLTRSSDWYKTKNTYVTNRSSPTYSYGFPTKIETWSSLGGGTRITGIAYLKDADDWILGLTDTVTRNGVLFDDYGYDTKGRVTSLKQFGTTVVSRDYYTTGTQSGRLNWQRDALNRQTTFASWHRGIPRTVTLADSSTFTRVVDSNGWVKSETNPRGYTTSLTYDSVGRLTTINRPTPWTDTTFTYTYSSGNLLQTATRGTEKVTTTYDAMLRPTRVRQEALSGGGGSIYTETEYDPLGQVVFVSLPATSTGSNVGIETSYDALGRVVQTHETATGGGTTTTVYLSSNRTQITDPLGNISTTTRSGYGSPDDGNVVKVQQPAGITVDSAFDIYGNLTTITQAKTSGTHVSAFFYDSRKRLCRRSIPETGDTLYAYNNANELTAYAEGQASDSTCITPPAASAISLSYDSRGRLTTTNYPGTTPDISRTYDANSNLLTSNRGGANWTYTYNNLDLPASETLVIDARTYAISNTWDNNERLTQKVFPSGNTYTYTNDGLGRPTTLKQGSTSYATGIAWHANGKLSSLTRGNGDVFTQSLNPRQLVSFIGSNIGADLSYSYNAKGQVSSIDSASNDRDRTFNYDGAGRLSSAIGPWGSGSYQYDPLNNLSQKTLGSRVVDIETNSLNRVNRVRDSTVGSTWRSYTHDTRGNVTNDGIHGFVYDFANQPISISGVDTGTFSYDGNLKRVKQVVNGQTSYSVYDRGGALLTRDNASSSEKTDYLAIAGQTFVRVKNNVASYPLNDHLGTAFALATQGGSIPGNQSYHTTPFGEAWGANAPTDEQGFTGHVEDATGLTYMQARYYDPVIGRFLSPDPIGYADQLNLYAYVGNDPVNRTDPTGMACFTMAAVMGSTCSFTGQIPELALPPPKTFRKESGENAATQQDDNLSKMRFPKGREKIQLTYDFAVKNNTDIRFSRKFKIRDLGGVTVGKAVPGTSRFTMTLDDRFTEEMDIKGMELLLDTIIHEGLHQTFSIFKNIQLGADHPEIYAETLRRVSEQREPYHELLEENFK